MWKLCIGLAATELLLVAWLLKEVSADPSSVNRAGSTPQSVFLILVLCILAMVINAIVLLFREEEGVRIAVVSFIMLEAINPFMAYYDARGLQWQTGLLAILDFQFILVGLLGIVSAAIRLFVLLFMELLPPGRFRML